MTRLIKQNKIREIIQKKGFRVGKETIEKISIELEKHAELIIEKTIRNARIFGRRTVKEEDLEFGDG